MNENRQKEERKTEEDEEEEEEVEEFCIQARKAKAQARSIKSN